MIKYKIEVQRFKPSGKYYDTTYFETEQDSWYEVCKEFDKAIQDDSDIRYSNYYVLLTGEGHSEGYPMLYPLFFTETRQEVLEKDYAPINYR